MRRKLMLILAVVVLSSLIPAGIVLADKTAEDCKDGVWVVEPNQTLYFIAYTCNRTVDQLVAYNKIENPNLIRTGQIIYIPPQDWKPGDPIPGNPAEPTEEPEDTPTDEPDGTPTETPQSPPAGSGDVGIEIGEIRYAGDRRVAEVDITVTNYGVQPALAGGRFYPYSEDRPEEDGPYWVTLLGAIHDVIPYPDPGDAPLWQAIVHTDDGLEFSALVGCIYYEEIHAEGDEPINREKGEWFHWEATLEGGWFDCGNAYQVKPEDLLPGDTASAPLTIYLMHPRLWQEEPFGWRNVTQIDIVKVFDTLGNSISVLATKTY